MKGKDEKDEKDEKRNSNNLETFHHAHNCAPSCSRRIYALNHISLWEKNKNDV